MAAAGVAKLSITTAIVVLNIILTPVSPCSVVSSSLLRAFEHRPERFVTSGHQGVVVGNLNDCHQNLTELPEVRPAVFNPSMITMGRTSVAPATKSLIYVSIDTTAGVAKTISQKIATAA
ncbi:hypothetical protein [Rhizobium sp. Leaf306]|uniref:hypothetical protein n=1 Tax=Rhizobium sp. Leaf306 TaxID=1736330 RepID=UPI0012E8D7D5|nr:hypothetical protein [Rhizobium sp. Leaf306]